MAEQGPRESTSAGVVAEAAVVIAHAPQIKDERLAACMGGRHDADIFVAIQDGEAFVMRQGDDVIAMPLVVLLDVMRAAKRQLEPLAGQRPQGPSLRRRIARALIPGVMLFAAPVVMVGLGQALLVLRGGW